MDSRDFRPLRLDEEPYADAAEWFHPSYNLKYSAEAGDLVVHVVDKPHTIDFDGPLELVDG